MYEYLPLGNGSLSHSPCVPGMRRKQNVEVSFLGQKWHSSLDFYSLLSLVPSSFTFLASRFFFVICWAFTRLHFGGKHFYGKAFRVVGLDGRRVRDGWVVEQEFHTQLGPTLHGFSSFLRPLWLKHANSGKLV